MSGFDVGSLLRGAVVGPQRYQPGSVASTKERDPVVLMKGFTPSHGYEPLLDPNTANNTKHLLHHIQNEKAIVRRLFSAFVFLWELVQKYNPRPNCVFPDCSELGSTKTKSLRNNDSSASHSLTPDQERSQKYVFGEEEATTAPIGSTGPQLWAEVCPLTEAHN